MDSKIRKGTSRKFSGLYYDKNYVVDIPYEFPDHKGLACSGEEFVRLVRASLSLDTEEKLRTLSYLPELSVFQINALVGTFKDEFREFQLLYVNERENVEDLLDKREREWIDIVQIIRDGIGKTLKYCSFGLKTPETISDLTRQYVIGQPKAIRQLAATVYWHLLNQSKARKTGKPNTLQVGPVLLVGPTGSGKTFLVEKICKVAHTPLIQIDASSMVPEGIVGFSTNDLAKRILEEANNDVDQAEQATIFFDEVDKMPATEHGRAVMSQLLRLLEGTELRLSADRWDSHSDRPPVRGLKTGRMLFILGGAFQHLYETKHKPGFTMSHDNNKTFLPELEESGLPRELLGRVKKVIVLAALTQEDYYLILKNGKGSALTDFSTLLSNHDISVDFDDSALMYLAERAASHPYGARTLRQLLGTIFEEILFNSPSNPEQTIKISKQDVENLLTYH